MLILPILVVAQASQTVALEPGMRITHSVTIARRTYDLPATDDLDTPVITITGRHIVVDFDGAVLRGSKPSTAPNERRGLAILIENSEGVTIKNAAVRGYKLAVLGRNCKGLTLSHCDFSYNWKQHLKSTLEREDESDWMSFHHNEHDEWIRGHGNEPAYGAGGVYLSSCTQFGVDHCKNIGSQCGLMLNRCTGGRVAYNNFSFLSGVGLGLYRSNKTLVWDNRFDWCVRGYSHGVYSRGQDSAGILVYEQSSDNEFIFNSVTHGGDGFFLWAGQTTMDTGQGGCNGNIVSRNDFSHSPANGIEATFSSNTFDSNLMLECWHGIWAGYSYDSTISDNVFGYNAEAIAIEHGQRNEIQDNEFDYDGVGVRLWMNDSPPDPNWGYPKHRDTQSKGYAIAGNTFTGESTAFDIERTSGVQITKNTLTRCGEPLKVPPPKDLKFEHNRLSVSNLPPTTYGKSNWTVVDPIYATPAPGIGERGVSGEHWAPLSDGYLGRFNSEWYVVPKNIVRGSSFEWPFLKQGVLRGRRYILVDDWGPYDFLSPVLWPRGEGKDSHGRTIKRFEILGPPGRWKLLNSERAKSLSVTSGSVPGTLDVLPTEGAHNLKIDLEYAGAKIVTRFGEEIPPGTPCRFGYESPTKP